MVWSDFDLNCTSVASKFIWSAGMSLSSLLVTNASASEDENVLFFLSEKNLAFSDSFGMFAIFVFSPESYQRHKSTCWNCEGSFQIELKPVVDAICFGVFCQLLVDNKQVYVSGL
jgi:hypothetical protein